jgi:hypothetical protein
MTQEEKIAGYAVSMMLMTTSPMRDELDALITDHAGEATLPNRVRDAIKARMPAAKKHLADGMNTAALVEDWDTIRSGSAEGWQAAVEATGDYSDGHCPSAADTQLMMGRLLA